MRLRSPGYEAFLKEVDARHNATIRVTDSDNLALGMRGLKIYIDGNVRSTPQRLRHLATPNCEVIPVVPGKHRVVVREAEINKPNRAESNTLFVELGQGEEATIAVQAETNTFAIWRTDV
jgi:hypothetical protein